MKIQGRVFQKREKIFHLSLLGRTAQGQKPRYYKSPVSRVFTCFIKVVYSPTGIEKVLPSG